MTALLTFLLGAIGGFAAHIFSMKVGFKQRTIDNKIKVFVSLIGTWVEMRNFIFAHHAGTHLEGLSAEALFQYDQMYGKSQQLIGEAILICDDQNLTDELNSLNEKLYRTPWSQMDLEAVNTDIENFKIEAFSAVAKMRKDIKRSTRFELSDFSHLLGKEDS